MNRLLAENGTTGKYEIVNSTAGSLNTTGGGGGGVDDSVIIKGVTDIDDPTNTIKNIKVDSAGSVKVTDISITSGNTTNVNNAQQVLNYGKDVSTGSLTALPLSGNNILVNDSKISTGNGATGVGQLMQQVLIYGRNPDGTLQPLETLGDRLLVDVLELTPSGKISTSSALSSVQICGYSQTDNLFRTLQTEADGKLNVGLNGFTDIADGSTAVRAKISTQGSISVKQDDHASVVVQGVSDQANAFATKKPLLINTDGKLLVETTSSTVAPVSSATTLSAVQICGYDETGTSLDVLKIDTVGNLKTANNTPINRGTITFPAPFGAGATSTSVDVGNYKNFHFHTEGSATSGHAGFILQGSNDNTNFVKIQSYTPQSVAGVDNIRGSIQDGYRYYRLENGGLSVSITTSIYNLYN